MVIVCVLFCIVSAIIAHKIEKKIINPVTIMMTLWGIIIPLSAARYYGLNELSSEVVIVIFVGLLGFFIGYLLFIANHKYNYVVFTFGNKAGNKAKIDFNYNMIIVLQVITIVLLVPDAINGIVSLMRGLSFADIRSGNTDILVNRSSSNIIGILRQYVGRPFSFAILPVCAELYWSRKGSKLIYLLTLLIAFLSLLSDGGRAILIYLAIHFCLVSRFYLKSRQDDTQRILYTQKIIAIIILAVLFYVVVTVTISRGSENALNTAYKYFCAPLQNFDARLNAIKAETPYSLGIASLFGYATFLDLVLSKFGIGLPFYNLVQNILIGFEQTIQIGNNTKMNAFVTCFAYMYLDGGIIGVFFISLIYSWISTNVYRWAIMTKNPKAICCYSLIVQGLLFSMVRFQFSTVFYAFSFVMLKFVFRKMKSSE